MTLRCAYGLYTATNIAGTTLPTETNMTRSAALVSGMKRVAAVSAILGFASIGIIAAPKPANAWWYHHYGYGYGHALCCHVYSRPFIVVAPRVYIPPPVYDAPRPVYIAPVQ